MLEKILFTHKFIYKMDRATSPKRHVQIDPRTMTKAQMLDIIKRRSEESDRVFAKMIATHAESQASLDRMSRMIDSWLQWEK